jgi:hypothetical protein
VILPRGPYFINTLMKRLDANRAFFIEDDDSGCNGYASTRCL